MLVPPIAWLVLAKRPGARIPVALPIVLSGVVLVSGALEAGAYGSNPSRGVLFGVLTGTSCAGFILLLRRGTRDDRRPAGPLFDATLRLHGGRGGDPVRSATSTSTRRGPPLLGESPSALQLVGVGCIIGGLLTIVRRGAEKSQTPVEA